MFPSAKEDKPNSRGSVGSRGIPNSIGHGGAGNSSSPIHPTNMISGPSPDGLAFNLPQHAMIGAIHQELSSVTSMKRQQQSSVPRTNFHQNLLQTPQSLHSQSPNNTFSQLLMALNVMGVLPNGQFPLQGLAGLTPVILNAMATGQAQQQLQLQLQLQLHLLQQQQQQLASIAPSNFDPPQLKPASMGLAGVVADASASEAASTISSPILHLAGSGINPAARQKFLQASSVGNFRPTQRPISQTTPSEKQRLDLGDDHSYYGLQVPAVSDASITLAQQSSSSWSTDMEEQSVVAQSIRGRKEDTSAVESLSSTESTEGSGSSSWFLPKITVILPCRARGMPLDHNFKNAHFVIPHDVRHGKDLMCSYGKCRDSGSKSRYCAECRIPVAKRNFHQRHGHGLVCVNASDWAAAPVAMSPCSSSTSAPASDSAKESPVTRAFRSSKTTIARPVAAAATPVADYKKRKLQEHSESNTSTSPIFPSSHPRNSGGALSKRRRRAVAVARAASSGSEAGPQFAKFDDIPVSRQLRWATLLGQRPDPNDADGTSAWLLEVMTVSDLKHPLLGRGAGGFASSSHFTNKRGSDEPDLVVADSNNDSSARTMGGSSVYSSLARDILTSDDVSSEEAAQDRCRKNDNPMAEPEEQERMPSKKLNRGSNVQETSHQNDVGDTIFVWQEKKKEAQKRREHRALKKKKRRSKTTKEERVFRYFRDEIIVPSQGGAVTGDSNGRQMHADMERATQEDLSSTDSPDNEDLSASYAEWQARKKKKALKNHKAESGAVVT